MKQCILIFNKFYDSYKFKPDLCTFTVRNLHKKQHLNLPKLLYLILIT